MPRRRHQPPAFALLELATACAALVILLGLAVSLARFVRSESGFDAFRRQLQPLAATLAEKGVAKDFPMFAAGLTAADEKRDPARLHELARQNAESWASSLGVEPSATLDVWGSPIVLVNGVHPALGMAPRGRPFLVSAGADGRYFTLMDNLYDYDLDVRSPATSPRGGGHGE